MKQEPVDEDSEGPTIVSLCEDESGDPTEENEEERILEVLKLADELDNCHDDVQKETAEVKLLLVSAANALNFEEMDRLRERARPLVKLTDLITERKKELKEKAWKAMGEERQGEEMSIGAIVKKMGTAHEEAVKKLEGLRNQRRTFEINEAIEESEKKLRELRKAEATLLFDLRNLVVGFPKKLKDIKEGKVKDVKAEVKEEPEHPKRARCE